jgi:ADP-ribosylglycohydrolase
LFGHGGGYSQNGYYREDRANRRIIFDSTMTEDTVILEYVTSGYVPGQTTLVDAQAKQCMMDWIHWQSMAMKPELAQLAEVARRTFAASRRLLSLRKSSITLNEFVQASRYSYKQTIKN